MMVGRGVERRQKPVAQKEKAVAEAVAEKGKTQEAAPAPRVHEVEKDKAAEKERPAEVSATSAWHPLVPPTPAFVGPSPFAAGAGPAAVWFVRADQPASLHSLSWSTRWTQISGTNHGRRLSRAETTLQKGLLLQDKRGLLRQAIQLTPFS